jgi:hypothetical protein
MAYLRQQGGKRIGPLPLLVATGTLAVVVLLLLVGGGGSAAPKQQEQQQRQVVEASRWAGVPEVSLKQQVPSWAGCPQIPCQYGEMKDGVPDTSVSCASAIDCATPMLLLPGQLAAQGAGCSSACPM